MNGPCAIHAMLVDDDEADRRLFDHHFRRCCPAGRLTQVESVERAMCVLESATARPDIAFVDVRMPDLPGPVLVQWIRERDDLKALMVVVLTGDVTCVQRAGPDAFGADAVLLKPIEYEFLGSILEVVRAYRRSKSSAPKLEETP